MHELEVTPFLQQTALVELCAARGVRLVAQSPLANGGAPGARLLAEPALRAIAARRGATPAQVALRWCLERGIAPVVASSSAAHLREDLGAAALALDDDDMAAIAALDRGERCGFDPNLIA